MVQAAGFPGQSERLWREDALAEEVVSGVKEEQD